MAKDKWDSKGGDSKGGGSQNPIQVQKFLGGLDFPAGKKEIIAKAKEKWADKNVLDALESLPDREYDGPNGISKELGGGKK